MTHLRAMTSRLPLLYAQGETLESLLFPPALQLEAIDEDLALIRRAHMFDTAPEREEAVRLAAVLGIDAEEWQDLGEFRAWVHALRDAMVKRGGVTVAALRGFVDDYGKAFQESAGLFAFDFGEAWAEPDDAAGRRRFEEWPRRVRHLRFGASTEPLQRITVDNGGLDEAVLAFLVLGLPEGPEHVPVLANLTTGEALALHGSLAPGQRLWVRPDGEGGVTARREGEDVTHLLRHVSPVTPGSGWTPDQAGPAQPLRLARGPNDLWFLPVAHHDLPGLDRFLLGLADLALEQGRWDEATLDHALFYQDPAVRIDLAWVETAPATVDVTLPGGALRHRPLGLDAALGRRDELVDGIDRGLHKLAAAGVVTRVTAAPHTSVQRQLDALVDVLPRTVREGGATGVDAMPDAGGVWERTDFEESTFR